MTVPLRIVCVSCDVLTTQRPFSFRHHVSVSLSPTPRTSIGHVRRPALHGETGERAEKQRPTPEGNRGGRGLVSRHRASPLGSGRGRGPLTLLPFLLLFSIKSDASCCRVETNSPVSTANRAPTTMGTSSCSQWYWPRWGLSEPGCSKKRSSR